MFNTRLNNAIDYACRKFNVSFEYNEITKEINDFQHKYKKLLIPSVRNSPEIDTRINEFDFVLTIFNELYDLLIKLLFQNRLIIWAKDERPFGLGFVYLFRFLVQDVIVLRNLAAMGYENQFNSISRNLIEKINIILLSSYDYDFSREYFFNDSGLDEKTRFYKLTRPSSIAKIIKTKLIELQKVKKTPKNNIDQAFEVAFNFLFEESLAWTHTHASLFTHSNDMNRIMQYYNDNGRFNISLKCNDSVYFTARLDVIIEYLIIQYTHLSYIFTSLHKEKSKHLCLALGYYNSLIKDKYTDELN